LVVVVAGDDSEGLHHQSKQIVSAYEDDHKKIFAALLQECKDITHYDTIYFLDGTPSHAGENEFALSEQFKGELYSPGCATWPILKKRVNGKLLYATHHGPAAGKGFNRGNAIRNKLKQIHYQNSMYKQPIPDIVVWADKHDHWEEVVHFQDGRTMKGYVLPSWKLLDEYMYKVDATAFSNIGAMLSTCTDEGIESEFLTIHIEQNPIGDL
jgi:hypothetical protein